jgi:hypothetical protein
MLERRQLFAAKALITGNLHDGRVPHAKRHQDDSKRVSRLNGRDHCVHIR